MADAVEEERQADGERHDEELLTVDQAAALLKLNPQTIRNHIDAGELPVIRIGRRIRIQRSALEAAVGWQRDSAALPLAAAGPERPAHQP